VSDVVAFFCYVESPVGLKYCFVLMQSSGKSTKIGFPALERLITIWHQHYLNLETCYSVMFSVSSPRDYKSTWT